MQSGQSACLAVVLHQQIHELGGSFHGLVGELVSCGQELLAVRPEEGGIVPLQQPGVAWNWLVPSQ